MPTSTNVTNLKINELTEAQYDTAVQQGIIGENELSVITDMTDKAVQVSALPTASVAEENNIYQFVGTTDANYTNGYFYKCVSDGQNPATYSWEAVNVQPSSGGSYLPLSGGTMTGVIDFDVPSWQRVEILSKTTSGSTDGIIGATNSGIEIGNRQGGTVTICGNMTWYTAGYIFGGQYRYCEQMFVKKLNAGIDNGINGQDIIVPQTGGTMVVADYTSAQQGDVLTLDNNGNAVWAAGASGTSSISVTLPAASWVNDEQTVTATGVTASNTVIVGAAPASASEYNTSGVICTAQGADSLTFSCSTTPSNDLTVTVLIF